MIQQVNTKAVSRTEDLLMSFIYSLCRTIDRKTLMSISGLLLSLVLLTSCGGTTPPPQPPPLQFTSINLGLPPDALNAPVVGPLPASTPMHVDITFKANQQLLAQLDQKNVQSGQSFDLETVANKLGIDDLTYQRIKNFLGVNGVTLKLSKLHTNLTIDAKASTFARLFQTSFVIHKLKNRTFYAPATSPKLPTFIANIVIAITGLDNYATLQSGHVARRPLSSSRHNTVDCQPLSGTLLPNQVAHAYAYDQLWSQGLRGEGMTVNLIELDGFYTSDIQNYFNCVHFHGNLKVVNVNSSPTKVDLESTLDIETIAGLAPAINIVDYQGPNSFTEFNDELQQVLNDNTRNTNSGSVVSISWGSAEDQLAGNNIAAIDQSIELLTKAEHMTVFADTYDCAAFADETYNHLSVSFPASDPLAAAVGGTVLNVDRAGNRTNEIVWSNSSNRKICNNEWGSGGGLSTIFKRPLWQDGQVVQNKYTNGTRQLPDLSAIASSQALYFQSQWWDAFGTSEATPTWATGMALVNEDLIKQVHQFFYSPQLFYMVANDSGNLHLHPYYDVTKGNNLYYPATPGWDFASGLGTPNLEDFASALLWATIHH
jgi:kumamolisin